MIDESKIEIKENQKDLIEYDNLVQSIESGFKAIMGNKNP
jgi:hypothetical protein